MRNTNLNSTFRTPHSALRTQIHCRWAGCSTGSHKPGAVGSIPTSATLQLGSFVYRFRTPASQAGKKGSIPLRATTSGAICKLAKQRSLDLRVCGFDSLWRYSTTIYGLLVYRDDTCLASRRAGFDSPAGPLFQLSLIHISEPTRPY